VPELRFLIADDHNVFRRGVRAVVENYPNWTVVAEACNGREAIEKAKFVKPDVAILDFSMPEINGLDAARDVLSNLPDTKVLILTIHDNDELIEEMRRAAISYLRLKLCSRTKPSIQQRRRLPLTDRERATPETPRRV
jgi:DNA-binding NarL/FixJ family response regulator